MGSKSASIHNDEVTTGFKEEESAKLTGEVPDAKKVAGPKVDGYKKSRKKPQLYDFDQDWCGGGQKMQCKSTNPDYAACEKKRKTQEASTTKVTMADKVTP